MLCEPTKDRSAGRTLPSPERAYPSYLINSFIIYNKIPAVYAERNDLVHKSAKLLSDMLFVRRRF